MSDSGASAGARTRDTLKDPRAVAAGSAAVLAAVLGVGQLMVARLFGVLSGHTNGSTGTVDESSLVIWLAAAAVGLGAAGSLVFLKSVPGRRLRLALAGMAALGALLAAPVATAIAAWSNMYGGDLSVTRALRLVFLGVVLGCGAALLAVRSKLAAWSLVCWLGVVWLLLTVSALLGGGVPTISYVESVPEWVAGALLMVLSAAVGAGLGCAAIRCGWARDARRRKLSMARVATGPVLVCAAYGVAVLSDGGGRVVHAVCLVLAALVVVGAAFVAAIITHRKRRWTATMSR